MGVLIQTGTAPATAVVTYAAAACEGEGDPTEGEIEGEEEPSLEDIANSLLDQFMQRMLTVTDSLGYDEAHTIIPELNEDQLNELYADGDFS